MAVLTPREVLTPDALSLLQTVARAGSFAAAARELGLVPSAVTYRVRQVEDALDALLFDRASRQARLTEAGAELLREGERLLGEVDAVANRVRRVATGWESSSPSRSTRGDRRCHGDGAGPGLLRGRAQHPAAAARRGAVRHAGGRGQRPGRPGDRRDGRAEQLGRRAQPRAGRTALRVRVAPHHPLASLPEPLADEQLQRHRVVAVADSVQRGAGSPWACWPGRTCSPCPPCAPSSTPSCAAWASASCPSRWRVPSSPPAGWCQAHHAPQRACRMSYAWRDGGALGPGKGLQWWLQQLESEATRKALLERHSGPLLG
jgi:molybdate transport repressor ModE-like protein